MPTSTVTPETMKQEFIKNHPRRTDFAFRASRTGSHYEDGTVFYNYEGSTLYLFKNIEDFANYFFLDMDVEHEEADHVGTRKEDGSIEWLGEAYPDEALDLDDDGDSVYTKFKAVKA